MIPQTQITEVRPDAEYAIGHQCGPTYNGPTGGYAFESGLLAESVPGWRLLQNGMVSMTHFWEVREGYALSWAGDAWEYSPVLAPKPMAKVSVAVEPIAKSDKPKRVAKKKAVKKGRK